MTEEEYWKFLFEDQAKVVKRDHRKEPPGTVVIFRGYYGTSLWRKTETGWDHEVRTSTDEA